MEGQEIQRGEWEAFCIMGIIGFFFSRFFAGFWQSGKSVTRGGCISSPHIGERSGTRCKACQSFAPCAAVVDG